MSDRSRPDRMDVDELAQRCREESNRFFRDAGSDDRYCYELFRRALVESDEHAWDALWTNYRNLVSGWIRKQGGFESTNTSIEELVTLSFEKFWHATARRDRFDRFPSLQALLQYLRTCCASTVTDRLRRRRQDRFLSDIDEAYFLSTDSKPDRDVLDGERRREFWRLIRSQLHDEKEELLIRSYFITGLKPRQIHERYPALFPDVQDVYRVKRNIMNRLRRASDLDLLE